MKLEYLFFKILLFFGLAAFPQLTNKGKFTISPNSKVTVSEIFTNENSGTLVNDGELFLEKDFINEGEVLFTPTTTDGIVYFYGEFKQQLRSTSTSYFNNIVFENPSHEPAFELNGTISISNFAAFNEGILDNTFGGTFIFENQSDYINASDKSYIRGTVQKKGEDSFAFPIGDRGIYRPSLISASNNTESTFSALYHSENSDINYPHSSKEANIDVINDVEYWSLSKDSGDQNVLLTLRWHSETVSFDIFSENASSIHIVRWDLDTEEWIDEGGVLELSGETITTVSKVEKYGIFTLAKMKKANLNLGDLTIYNTFSYNGNDKNSFFYVEGIDDFPENSVQVFNQSGIRVFETKGYDESDNVFKGISKGKIEIRKNETLPPGTYYYIISYKKGAAQKKEVGYLYINGN